MKRRAFTLIELALSLAIIGLLMLSAVKFVNRVTDDTMVKQEYLNAYRFEIGIKNSFTEILNTFEPICGNIPNDGVASMAWGWANTSCLNTSPLPRKSGNNLVYDINLGSLTAGMQASVKNKIVSSYAPMCKMTASTATSITLYCGPTFSGFQYSTSAGAVSQYHTPGTNFDMIDTPTPILTLTRKYHEGSGSGTKIYQLNLSDIFQERLAYSGLKMENIGRSLKNIYNAKLGKETANTSPLGLNSIDDELIPWYWVAFGDSSAEAITTLCTKNAGTGACDNLNTNNIWRATAGDALLWRRLISGIFANDHKYTVDGFGNPLRIYPILSQCAGTNLAACAVVSPTVPIQPYPIATTLKPPYVSIIHSNVSSAGVTCSDISTQAPMSCRYPVVY